MSDALLVTLVLLPVALTFLLKSSGAAGFLALCGGFAVIALSGSDIQHLVGKTKITSLTSNDVDLLLLIAPLLMTLLLTFKGAGGKSQRWLQLIPALCAGGLLATVAAPMFNDALNINIADSPFWKDVQNFQSYIVSIGLLASLLLIWSGSSRLHTKKHK